MKNIIFMCCLSLIACEKPAPRVYTELQLKAVQSMTPVQQAFMEACYIDHSYHRFDDCLKQMEPAPCVQKSGSSVGATAVGTALGIGAGKLLFGK